MKFSQRLHVGNRHAGFVGNFGRTAPHAHGALALLYSLSGEIEIECDGVVTRCQSALIDTGVTHIVECGEEHLSTLYIEPDSMAFHALRQEYLADRQVEFDMIPARRITREMEDIVLRGHVAQLLNRDNIGPHSPLDLRVRRTIQKMRTPGFELSGRNPAAIAQNLSPSRFSHLFRDQAKISYRRYKLWSQIAEFARQTASAENFTDAAVAAGFYDAAHFNNTFRSFFGITPTTIFGHLDGFSMDPIHPHR